MFEAAGWHTETVKYGRRLRALFARDGGEALRARIDAMGNEEYQRLLRADDAQLRERLPGGDDGHRAADRRPRPARAAGRLPRPRRPRPRGAARGLPRHRRRPRPPVGRLRLHDQGLVAAHRGPSRPTTRRCSTTSSSLDLAAAARHRRRGPVARLRRGLAPRGGCAPRRRRACEREPVERHEPPAGAARARAHARGHGLDPAGARAPVRRARPRGARGRRARGHRLARRRPPRPTSAAGSTARASGASASASTGSPTTPTPSCAGASPTTGATSSSASRRSTSSGCSASWRDVEPDGRPLLPVGTIYDPFVTRAHEPWSFGIYAGGQSILVGTPSGITLGPEGGAHQSVITPSVGIEQPGLRGVGAGLHPGLRMVLPARARPAGPRGRQLGLLPPVDATAGPGARGGAARRARRARSAAATCWPAATACARAATLTIVAMGAVVPEALEAAEELDAEVVCLDEPRPRLPRAAGSRRAGRRRPRDSRAPVPGAAPAGHAWSTATRTRWPSWPACTARRSPASGVSQFGQSGDIADLYRHHGVDAETIVGAALDLTG